MHAKIKSHKENLEINVFSGNDPKSSYNNLLTRDPNRIAQVFLDLMIMGFPIEKAIARFLERIKKKDWFG